MRRGPEDERLPTRRATSHAPLMSRAGGAWYHAKGPAVDVRRGATAPQSLDHVRRARRGAGGLPEMIAKQCERRDKDHEHRWRDSVRSPSGKVKIRLERWCAGVEVPDGH